MNRTRVDNAASTALSHQWNRVLAQKEWPFEIDRQHCVPKLLSRLFKRGAWVDACIVYKYIEAPELVCRRLYGMPAVSLASHIRRLKEGTSAATPYLSGGFFATAGL